MTSTPRSTQPDSEQMKGTIIRMLPNKGFSFVRGEDGLTRFAHADQYRPRMAFDTAREGDAVTFIPASGAQGKGNGLRCTEINVEKVAN